MIRRLFAVGIALGLLVTPAAASGKGSHPKKAAATKFESCPRNTKGKIQRSDARDARLGKTGYSYGRPGYVIDHVKPLACGGADDPSNMQWQTIAEAKAKDKIERIGCH